MQICDAADALTENGANPHVITGALIEMSTFTDALPTSRLSNDSRVAPEYNAGFTGASARIACCCSGRIPAGAPPICMQKGHCKSRLTFLSTDCTVAFC